MKKINLLLFLSLVFSACESTADVNLSPAVPTLVVDAFITDQPEDQRIVLNFSQAFFDNTEYIPAAGATVQVLVNGGNSLSFTESTTPGLYLWKSTAQQPTIGQVGDTFTLLIDYEGEVYEANTTMGRTTPIEEILFFEETEPFSDDLIYEGRITARDAAGVGDAYWLKTFWNGEFLDQPSELNFAFDAGLSPGAEIDGQEFIIPVKAGINPTGEDESYVPGDTVRVEIHSISQATYDYFVQLQIQTDRPGGFAELFAQPLANLPSNISASSNPELKALGFFSVSAVSSMEVQFTEDLIRE